MASKKSSIDQDLIRELAALLKETELNEIEVEQGNLRIKVARGGGGAVQVAAAPAQPPAAAPVAEAKSKEPSSSAAPLTSPMVGTAYLAPAPGADNFVSVGSKVKAGQTVVIVEAMKTMNQITADKAGTVTAILVENEQPVEFGEPLLVIE